MINLFIQTLDYPPCQSGIRGLEFVTRKIVNEVAKIHYGLERSKKIYANLVSQFLWAMHDNISPVLYGDGEQKRDFVFIEDLVNALMLAAENNKKFNVYNVGTGKNYTLNELVKILNKHLNKNIKPEYIENPMKDTYVYYTKADIRKTENGIGFKAKISLDEGIDKLIKYYNY